MAGEEPDTQIGACRNRPVQKKQARRDGWTKDRRKLFLETLAETCNVTAATRAAGMNREGAYDVRRRDPAFAASWQEALEIGYERLEQALLAYALQSLTTGGTVAALPEADAAGAEQEESPKDVPPPHDAPNADAEARGGFSQTESRFPGGRGTPESNTFWGPQGRGPVSTQLVTGPRPSPGKRFYLDGSDSNADAGAEQTWVPAEAPPSKRPWLPKHGCAVPGSGIARLAPADAQLALALLNRHRATVEGQRAGPRGRRRATPEETNAALRKKLDVLARQLRAK